MAELARSVATLRIMGEDLIPEEVTKLLGVEPTKAEKKGDKIVGRNSGFVRIARTGLWRIEAAEREPGDLDAQIREIVEKTSSDLSVWRALGGRFKIDLFCGLFLSGSNEGVELSADALRALGERGIKIGLDIYSGSDDEE